MTRTGHVALTFDDGPAAESTAALLATLRAAGVRATLFNIGQNAQRHPELVRAQCAAGMWIGNHSWSHPYLTRSSTAELAAEISRTQDVLERLTGTAPVLFRPPYLDTDDAVRSVQARYGLVEITADVDSRDWSGISTDDIVQNVSAARAGDVILLHDWPPNTLAAIPRIVAGLADRGLSAGMISPVTGRAVAPPGDGPAGR